MSWIPIKEYIQEYRISDSTIRRRIRAKKLRSKRIGTKWFIWSNAELMTSQAGQETNQRQKDFQTKEKRDFERSRRQYIPRDDKTEIGPDEIGSSAYSVDSTQFSFPKTMVDKGNGSALSEIISFSSKALNSYLITNDKLIAEKEKRIEEKEFLIKSLSQKIAEMESYIKALETAEKKLRELMDKPEGWR